MISPALLSSLRSIAASFLPDAAALVRYTETSTADGTEQAWAIVAADVPCRVSRPGGAAAERAGEGAILRAVSDWVIWLPFDTDVTVKDRITVSATDRVDGRTFEVESVGEKTYEAARSCGCILVT